MAEPESGDRRPLLFVDVVMLLISFGLVALLALDADSAPGATGVRAVVSLLFVVFVPGWTTLRILGFGLESMTFVGSFVMSVTMMMITGLLMSTVLEWPWRAAGLGWGIACALGLVAVSRRTGRERMIRGWSP